MVGKPVLPEAGYRSEGLGARTTQAQGDFFLAKRFKQHLSPHHQFHLWTSTTTPLHLRNSTPVTFFAQRNRHNGQGRRGRKYRRALSSLKIFSHQWHTLLTCLLLQQGEKSLYVQFHRQRRHSCRPSIEASRASSSLDAVAGALDRR